MEKAKNKRANFNMHQLFLWLCYMPVTWLVKMLQSWSDSLTLRDGWHTDNTSLVGPGIIEITEEGWAPNIKVVSRGTLRKWCCLTKLILINFADTIINFADAVDRRRRTNESVTTSTAVSAMFSTRPLRLWLPIHLELSLRYRWSKFGRYTIVEYLTMKLEAAFL